MTARSSRGAAAVPTPATEMRGVSLLSVAQRYGEDVRASAARRGPDQPLQCDAIAQYGSRVRALRLRVVGSAVPNRIANSAGDDEDAMGIL